MNNMQTLEGITVWHFRASTLHLLSLQLHISHISAVGCLGCLRTLSLDYIRIPDLRSVVYMYIVHWECERRES